MAGLEGADAAPGSPGATAEDYAARYGEPEDAALVGTLLADAGNIMLSAYESRVGSPWVPGLLPAFDRSFAAVACKLAHQALSVPQGFAGATQYSQGAGGYTASVTYGGALGDMWLGRTDLRALGLDGSALSSLRPMVRGCDRDS